MKYKIGDKVRLNDTGIKEWGNQSRGSIGEISNIYGRADNRYQVRWSYNNHTNSYREIDLSRTMGKNNGVRKLILA